MIDEQELIRDLLMANNEWDGSGGGPSYRMACTVRNLLGKYMQKQEQRLMQEPKHPNHISHRYMK